MSRSRSLRLRLYELSQMTLRSPEGPLPRTSFLRALGYINTGVLVAMLALSLGNLLSKPAFSGNKGD